MTRVHTPSSRADTVATVPNTAHHPIFARVYGFLSRFDDSDFGPHRDELLRGLHGEVIEIGAGNGVNFNHFPASITSVTAIEPEPYLRRGAEARARTAPMPIRVLAAAAEALPVADDSFDAAVACLVLCSVNSPSTALAELRRVLRPGGELCFIEHVREPGGRRAAVQDLIDRSRIWPLIAGGCHCARDTSAAITAAGFEGVHARTVRIGPRWMPTNPVLIGTARAPDGSEAARTPDATLTPVPR